MSVVNIDLCIAIMAAVTSAIPSALIVINAKGQILHMVASKYSEKKCRRFVDKELFRIVKLIFGMPAADMVYNTYQECYHSGTPRELFKLEHITARGLKEYFQWHFFPEPSTGNTIIFVRNITETTLLTEEFLHITEQYATVNQELCVAMSKLDLHLMDLEQAHKKLAALYRITAIVQKTVNENEVLNEILDGITRELGFTCAAILLLDKDRQELTMKAHRGYSNNVRIPLGKGITGYAALTGQLIYVPDVRHDPRYIKGTHDGVSEVAVPLIVNNEIIGVLDVETNQAKRLQDYDLDLLRSLASQISMTIAHANHVSRVELQAITDGLTGLYNYRYFQTLFEREFKRAVRYKRPLSLLMIDIDNFKLYNDTYGHRQGDYIIRTIANIIRQNCRDVDIVVRYGGEEFAVLFPETTIDEALKIAERIRKAVAEYPFANKHSQPGGVLTVSMGVAGYPYDAQSETELIDHADLALYRAKRTSKNRVCLYRDHLDAN